MLSCPKRLLVLLTLAATLLIVPASGAKMLRGRGQVHVAARTTAPAPPATNSSAPTCGNETLPAAPGGGQWQCSFDDEFDATTHDPDALNRSWWTPQLTADSGYVTGQLPGYACYADTPSTISVSGGNLHLSVVKSTPRNCYAVVNSQYIAGMVTTVNGFSQTYGHFEVRAELPPTTAPGLQETFWLWPENLKYGQWPASGELDFAEFHSEYANLDVPYFHYNFSAASANAQTHTNIVTANCPIATGTYNTFAIDWQPGSLIAYANGTICLVDDYAADNGLTGPQPFDQPFFLALTQALGENSNAALPRTPFPDTTSVDYVRVWRDTAQPAG